MRFADPHSVTCARCTTKTQQRVIDLLALRARCPSCGATFDESGLKMREMSDEWGSFYTLAIVSLHVEEQLGDAIEDAELEGVFTLRDLARLVERHLPPDPERANHAVTLVQQAALAASSSRWLPPEVREALKGPIDFDLRLMDAIRPDRWQSLEDGPQADT
jgi:hypothetical protein